jgi:hypothetical protein
MIILIFFAKKSDNTTYMVCLDGSGGPTSGSGWVAVVPLESGASGEHFGAKNMRIRVSLSELWVFEGK